MKHIFPIILIGLLVCISCRSKGSISESNGEQCDSIAITVDSLYSKPLGIFEKLGIECASHIEDGDTLPPPSENDYLLTTNEQASLLRGVITSDYNISDSTSVYLVAIKQINDSVILCQYKYLFSDVEGIYIATYDTQGDLIDAMFAGNGWNRSAFLRNSSDSTELISNNCTSINFIRNNEFTLSRVYKEIEHNVNSGQDTTTYVKTTSMTYRIDSDGKLLVTQPEADVFEEGIFRIWTGPEAKNEWDKIDNMHTLAMYPYSDEKVLDKWNDLGNQVDGALAESFESRFFEYVFLPRPEKVLRWLYDNRDNNSQNLTMPLEFEYAESPQRRQLIDAAIAKLDNPDMRAYFNGMLHR